MYRNSEHYPDPTAGAAIARVSGREQKKSRKDGRRKMKFVYICSPYRAYTGTTVEDNERRARRYCRFAAQKEAVPLAPHLIFTQFLNDAVPEEREAGLYLGRQLLKRCEEMWVFGSHTSEGMAAEIEAANKRGILVRYFNTKCEEVSG